MFKTIWEKKVWSLELTLEFTKSSDLTGLTTIWRQGQIKINFVKLPQFSSNISQVSPKRSPFSPNGLLGRRKFSRCFYIWNCSKFPRLFGDPAIWPQIPEHLLFSPNIHQVVENFSQGLAKCKSTVCHCSQCFRKVVPKNLKLANSCGIFFNYNNG